MPQMSPMPWLTLLMMTVYMLLILSTMLFFVKNTNKKSMQTKTKKTINIKW